MRRLALALGVLLAAIGPARAEEICVIGFNVESGGAELSRLEPLVARYAGCQLWGFSEVRNEDWAAGLAGALGRARGTDFGYVLGRTGGGDRLAVVYDAGRYALADAFELEEINIRGRVRAPLVAELVDRRDGLRFLLMVNHLYRTNEEGRHTQAQLLNDWGRLQTLPVIAVGDYNFDWQVVGGEWDHDAGYDRLVAGGVFAWVAPARMLKTQCSARYDSILDFVFTAGPARDWTARSAVLEDAPSYCDLEDDATSDHRPVIAYFTASPGRR